MQGIKLYLTNIPAVFTEYTLSISVFKQQRILQIGLLLMCCLVFFSKPIATSFADTFYSPVTTQKKVLGLFKKTSTAEHPAYDARLKQAHFALLFGSLMAYLLLFSRAHSLSQSSRPTQSSGTQFKKEASKTQQVVGPAGRYQIEGTIGKGGMASIYAATDLSLHRQIALKALDINLQVDEALKQRFIQEAHTVASLSHGNIVQIFDLFEHENQLWIAMELLTGGDLEQKIKLENISTHAALSICLQVAKGLSHAHSKGVLHRDIKPMNILFNDMGEVKVADFGIAKWADSNLETQVGLVMGSPNYMSPEQAAGETCDARSDIYALGTTLYYLLAGKLPFTGNTTEIMAKQITQIAPKLESLQENISPAISQLVEQAMAKKPEQRFQAMDEFAQAIQVQLVSLPVPEQAVLECSDGDKTII